MKKSVKIIMSFILAIILIICSSLSVFAYRVDYKTKTLHYQKNHVLYTVTGSLSLYAFVHPNSTENEHTCTSAEFVLSQRDFGTKTLQSDSYIRIDYIYTNYAGFNQQNGHVLKTLADYPSTYTHFDTGIVDVNGGFEEVIYKLSESTAHAYFRYSNSYLFDMTLMGSY